MSLKQKLYTYCLDLVEQKIASLKSAIDTVQASANEETKSSSGDKYETGRAMAQLEIEKLMGQLGESMRMKQALGQIKADKEYPAIQLGSLVYTNHGNFFIAVSLGQVKLDNQPWLVVSPASPVASQLIGLKAGGEFTFNGRIYKILQLA